MEANRAICQIHIRTAGIRSGWQLCLTAQQKAAFCHVRCPYKCIILSPS